jgi:DNA-binding SARP family transcriptional activator
MELTWDSSLTRRWGTVGAQLIPRHEVRTSAAQGRHKPEERERSVDERPRFSILGPMEVVDHSGRMVTPSAGRLRALLALLLIDANRVVSVDRLIDRIWAGQPPAGALATLHAYVSQLRRALDPDYAAGDAEQLIVTRPPGYLLRAAPNQIDVSRFENLLIDGEGLLAAGQAEAALEPLRRALALWRGQPLADVRPDADLTAVIERLTEMRLRALDTQVAALLASGHAAAAATAAETLVRERPLREGYWGRLMLAAYRAGRQADALKAFQECRRILDEELGLDPDPELAELHLRILRRDPALTAPSGPAVRTAAAVAEVVAEAPQLSASSVSDGLSSDGPRQPVIGRERELAAVANLVAAAKCGDGGMVLLEGEPGIGKTTIAEVAASAARSAGLRVVWARAVEDLGAPPLWLWEQVLRELGASFPVDVLGGDPAARRFRLLEAITAAVDEASRSGPLLLVLDDLQWGDAGTLQALRLLAGGIRGMSCAVVATCRDTDAADPAVLEDTLAGLARERSIRRLTLAPLSVAEVVQLLGDRPARREAYHLRERTGGNPFFLTELVRLLDSGGAGPFGGPTEPGVLPGTVRDVVQQRLGRLPAETQTMLRMAALSGVRIDVAVIAVAASLDPAGVHAALEPAVHSGLLHYDAERWSWRFAHDVSREAVAASLTPLKRPPLHTLLADAIEKVHADGLDQHLDELARHRYHAARGAASELAFQACTAAADHARRRLAYDQAARHREGALAALPAGDDRRFDTLITLTQEQRLAGQVQHAGATLAEAMRMARERGDTEGLGRAAAILGGVTLWNWRSYGEVDEHVIAVLRELVHHTVAPRQRAELLGTLAVELYYGPDRAAGEAFAGQAVAQARDLGDPALLGRALNNYVIAAWVPEREEQRLAALDESLRLAGAGLPVGTEVIARMHRLAVNLRLGRIDEYEADLRRCERLAPTLGIPEIEAQLTYQLGGHALLHGDVESARELIERGFQQQRRTSLWGAQWVRLVQLVTLERDHGDLGTLLAELVDLAARDEYVPLRPTAVLTLTECGEHADARQRLQRWGLDQRLPRPDWASDFSLAQLGEIAAQLGTPDPATLHTALTPLRERLVVAGTALACWGPTRKILERLEHRMADGARQGRR